MEQTTFSSQAGDRLAGLSWRPRWVSHLGCLLGCLDYLGIETTDGWLYGLTGHAFITNIHHQVAPSGPTAWKTERISRLAENVGCRIQRIYALNDWPDFTSRQQVAWETVRDSIRRGLPCYGWGLAGSEYYVITGIEAEGAGSGYYFQGPGFSTGSKQARPWRTLGEESGLLEVYTVEPGEAVSPVQAVKEALVFALEHAHFPGRWSQPYYTTGAESFDAWADALAAGQVDPTGHAYNTAVWGECRRMAHLFLHEASEKLPGHLRPLLRDAAGYYATSAHNLDWLAGAFPFFLPEEDKADRLRDPALRRVAVEVLTNAGKLETKALAALERIVEVL